MKLIKLTKGQFAKVDDLDYEWLNKSKWFAREFNYKGKSVFYASRKMIHNGIYKEVFMHNLIMNPKIGMFIDHIDRDSLNYQRLNLRECTRSENNMNRNGWGKSNYKGVTYNNGKIRTRIILNNKLIHIGYYKTKIEGALAYNEAALKYHGEFAKLNIIQ